MNPLSPAEVQGIDAQASALMKRGIRLMSEESRDAVIEALACFDRALELRSCLPIERDPILKYGLSACWLNRADALVRLDSPNELKTALQAYDAGIKLLRGLSLREDPRFPRRLAIALQNRGLALQALNDPPSNQVVTAFTNAIEVLDDETAEFITDRSRLLSTVWANLAMARVSAPDEESQTSAREAALRAIALVAGLEEEDADLAEVGLKARRVLCQILAAKLSLAPPTNGMPDDVHDATDLADDGLALIRRWEQRGVLRFESLENDLFRFGALVYERYQPQFLNEYLRDHRRS